jgi:hypothetical protein
LLLGTRRRSRGAGRPRFADNNNEKNTDDENNNDGTTMG